MAAMHLHLKSAVDGEDVIDFTPAQCAYRARIRTFIATKVTPFVAEWDEAGITPNHLRREAAAAGILSSYVHGFEDHPLLRDCVRAGVDLSDPASQLIHAIEWSRCGGGGLCAALLSHSIGLPPILALGSDAIKRRVAPRVLRGDAVIALAITEPWGGSDVANLRTTAVYDASDDCYVCSGEKMLITSGVRADFITIAVRTDPGKDAGLGGISLLLLERGMKGLEQRGPLPKQGWRSADAAHLVLTNVRVPSANMIGSEGAGFYGIMLNFNGERLGMAAQGVVYAALVTSAALHHAQSRRTFGKRLADHQVIRHKLMEMTRVVKASAALLWVTCRKLQRIARSSSAGDGAAGAPPSRALVVDLALLKVQTTKSLELCAREAMQIAGGHGYVRGGLAAVDGDESGATYGTAPRAELALIERMYREVRVMAIGGGSEEVMLDLAARQAKL